MSLQRLIGNFILYDSFRKEPTLPSSLTEGCRVYFRTHSRDFEERNTGVLRKRSEDSDYRWEVIPDEKAIKPLEGHINEAWHGALYAVIPIIEEAEYTPVSYENALPVGFNVGDTVQLKLDATYATQYGSPIAKIITHKNHTHRFVDEKGNAWSCAVKGIRHISPITNPPQCEVEVLMPLISGVSSMYRHTEAAIYVVPAFSKDGVITPEQTIELIPTREYYTGNGATRTTARDLLIEACTTKVYKDIKGATSANVRVSNTAVSCISIIN